MIEAIFIADLHLSEDSLSLNQCFTRFLKEDAIHAKSLYILGDFFNYWLGDDAMTNWHRDIAGQLADLVAMGTQVFFMAGNRDFLVGEGFLNTARCKSLPDPTCIELEGRRVLLKHGDDLCTLDKSHQWFRHISRTPWVAKIFLSLPLSWRQAIAKRLRRISRQGNAHKSQQLMDVVGVAVTNALSEHKAKILIHGHTHNPQIQWLRKDEGPHARLVLSDWGDTSSALCYYLTKGFVFKHI